MNHNTQAINTSPITRMMVNTQSRDYESLLDRIILRLTKFTKCYNMKGKKIHQHKSFIDENLLDPIMGPEIQRVLR